MNYRLVKDKAIISLIAANDYSAAASLLLNSQKETWQELKINCENRKHVKTKMISFNGFDMKLQHNPARMKSTSAKTDKETIEKRDCFLCAQNLPLNQETIEVCKGYLLLCNPYPVFPEHFTIIFHKHNQQEILISFTDFLQIGKRLGKRYSIIYNGPRCGASAPDHLHFQAGSKGFMPVEENYYALLNEYGETLINNSELNLYAVEDSLRKFMIIESKSLESINNTFLAVYNSWQKISESVEEPLMNIIGSYNEASGWRILVFPRAKHRSSHYFLEESRILFSPASIDIGGVCITPLEKDFERIDFLLMREVFVEIFPSDEVFDHLKSLLIETV